MKNVYFPTIFNIGPSAEEAGARRKAQTAVVLTEQDWQDLLADAKIRTYQADDVIIREGERSKALFLINKGDVRVIQQPGKTLDNHGPGAVFGEMSFLMQQVATASVIAVTPVEVSVFDIALVHKRLNSAPELAARFYQSLAVTLAHRLHQASRRLSQQKD